MLAERDPYIDDAAQRFYEACVDFSTRENLRAKRMYELREQKIIDMKNEIDVLRDEINSQKDEIAALQIQLSKYESSHK